MALDLIAKDYLKYFNDKNIECLILGCTHYPFIKDTIAKSLPNDINIYDPALITAIKLKQILTNNNLLNINNQQQYEHYYVTDNTERFYQIAAVLLNRINIDDVILN